MRITSLSEKFGIFNFTCDVCGRELFTGARLCDACRAALPRARCICPLCGRSVGEEGVCPECKERRNACEKCRSAFLHEGDAARLVRRYKDGARYLAATLAGEMLPLLLAFADAEALVPVPMTARAARRRGFDHGRLLAETLSGLCGLPVLAAAVKQRETAPQKTLSRRERERNLEGCFHIVRRAEVRGKTLLIADDTMTTGATVHELASALLRAKAKKVYAVTFTSVAYRDVFGLPPAETLRRPLP